MDQFRHNRLFLQAFNGGLDQCDIFEGSCLISSAYVFCGVGKTPESNMSLLCYKYSGTTGIRHPFRAFLCSSTAVHIRALD